MYTAATVCAAGQDSGVQVMAIAKRELIKCIRHDPNFMACYEIERGFTDLAWE